LEQDLDIFQNESKIGIKAEAATVIEAHGQPLISFCLFAYNQERYIREAVKGALSQTYSPLEIVLSDDCSTDRTFEIIKGMAAGYRGLHRIVLNRNPKNLGVGDHVNRVMEIARGILIVAAAGDDISFPQRTQALYDEWVKQNRRPTSIHSDYEIINERGEPVAENHPRCFFTGCRSKGIKDIIEFAKGKHSAAHIHGATHAWSCQIFRKIGPLKKNTFFEDKAIGFRSLITGEFAYVPQKLICYRLRSNNVGGRLQNNSLKIARVRKTLLQESIGSFQWLAVIKNYKTDVIDYTNRGVLFKGDGHAALREINRFVMVKKCEWMVCSGSPLIGLVWLICRLILLPETAYARIALKHWFFRSADYMGLLLRW
jgi:glycosyltransferase involved in cell wall biosynthesis